MAKMEEVRIGGSKTMDVIARQLADEDRIDCFINDRLIRTPQGELFEVLLMKVAPQCIGKHTPTEIVAFCEELAEKACFELAANHSLTFSEPSQATLRRKIAKHKEKANGNHS